MREQEPRDSGQDTEITLGVGPLLGLFFGLVILCGLALGTGYWLGRNSAKQAGSLPTSSATLSASQAQPSAGPKPGAAQPVVSQSTPQAGTVPASPAQASGCAAGENCTPQPDAAGGGTDLTFYQAVQQKEPHAQLAAPPPVHPAPAVAGEGHGTLGNGYLVQIAAVRNQDDARLLSETLRKQQYPVLISQPGDNLFHVQVGPYADIKEAEAIRSRLLSAGYNPFLKR